MPSILFLHLDLTHLLRCGEPISEIIFKPTESFGGFQGVSAVGRFNSQLCHLSKIPFESLRFPACVCACVCAHVWDICIMLLVLVLSQQQHPLPSPMYPSTASSVRQSSSTPVSVSPPPPPPLAHYTRSVVNADSQYHLCNATCNLWQLRQEKRLSRAVGCSRKAPVADNICDM